MDGADRLGVSPRLVVAIGLGILLNPLNSSMTAVALVTLQQQFEVGVATSAWLLSGFYLSAAIGQPMMGRLVDLFKPRQMFIAGLTLVLVASIAAPLAPGFWWLVAARAVQAFGGSVAFPTALVMLRATAPADQPPAGALAVLSATALSTVALGPVLGGAVIAVAGWRGLFWISALMTVIGIAAALAVLPRAPTRPRRSARAVVANLDLPGIALFATVVTSLLMALLSVAHRPHWWLTGVTVAAGVLLVLRERAVKVPFLDVRGLAGNLPLASVLAQQILGNLAIYAIFLGLPIWLAAARGLSAFTVGLLMLPLTVVGVLIVPVSARVIRRGGPRPAILMGSILMLTGTVGILLLDNRSPIVVLVAIGIVVGAGEGILLLALQTGLYATAPPERAGGSGGLFQTSRYVGAILATSLLGVAMERDLSTSGLHHVGVVIAIVASALVVLALLLPRHMGSSR